MALSYRVVVEVVRRRDLHHAGPELAVHILVGNDRNVAITQRQFDAPADQVLIALVFGMDHHRDIAEHGLGAGSGNGQMGQPARFVRFSERIADVPHEAVFFFLHHFQVGHGGVQLGVPVHQALAAIDQAFVVQAHESLGDGFI